MSDDREKKILADLALHPGWAILRKDLIEVKNAYFASLGRDLYNNKSVTDDDLHFKRGYFHGIFALLNGPTIRAKELERELAKELTQQREESIA
jgi:hypothetical protein